ncbi:MAG: hypothetical protein DMG62_05800 [Acidobacteria bacterium]|nr:MAG: hypothetical protein DMG62_05800 [Acidobacteriota bacterium]
MQSGFELYLLLMPVAHLARPHLFIEFSVQLVLVRLIHTGAQCCESLLRACDLSSTLSFCTALVCAHRVHNRSNNMLGNINVLQNAAELVRQFRFRSVR